MRFVEATTVIHLPTVSGSTITLLNLSSESKHERGGWVWFRIDIVREDQAN